MADFRKQRDLLARHLEVFVPKPKTRVLERHLVDWLDHLLEQERVPLDFPRDREDYLPREIRELLEGKAYWENIIFGYSTYATDGHYLGLSDAGERLIEGYIREGTLAIKFILTNYQTTVPPEGVGGIDAQSIGQMVSSGAIDRDKRRELIHLALADLHYRAVGAHIIRGITETVLWEEHEVWAHSWYTTLDRWLKEGLRPSPLVATPGEREQRFGAQADRVVCTLDYSIVR